MVKSNRAGVEQNQPNLRENAAMDRHQLRFDQAPSYALLKKTD
jgi:hypothetical protein